MRKGRRHGPGWSLHSPAPPGCQPMGTGPGRWLRQLLLMLTPVCPSSGWGGPRTERCRGTLPAMAFRIQESGSLPKQVNALRLTICLTYTSIYTSTSLISHTASSYFVFMTSTEIVYGKYVPVWTQNFFKKQPITIETKKIRIIHQSVQGKTSSACSISDRYFTSLGLMVPIRGMLLLLK